MVTAGLAQNYFKLFALAETYDLDLTELSSRYRNLQSAVHPDKFANATDQERRLSVQQSALINEAFQTLKNPLKRAQYMLGLRGVDVDNAAGSSMDAQFLMKQMQLREELEQVRDRENPSSTLMTISREIEQAIDEYQSVLSEMFKKSGDQHLDQISDYVRRMQFMVKLRSEVELLEEQLL